MAAQRRPAAIFDVDRTLLPGRSMERVFLPFLIKRGYLKFSDLTRFMSLLAQNLNELNSEFFQQNRFHLKDKDPRELERLAVECFQIKIKPLVSPKGRSELEKHRREGRMIVLLTGSLYPLAEQLKRELNADLVLAARLGEESGTLNGKLANRRPYGVEKARLVRSLVQEHGVDLENSYAYGDHGSDVEVLSAVGNPRAVNPDLTLRITARRRGWPILEF